MPWLRNGLKVILLLLPVAAAVAMDNELSNSKSGIDVLWGAGDGSDKGTAYAEE